jgi:hypothetical protein
MVIFNDFLGGKVAFLPAKNVIEKLHGKNSSDYQKTSTLFENTNSRILIGIETKIANQDTVSHKDIQV